MKIKFSRLGFSGCVVFLVSYFTMGQSGAAVMNRIGGYASNKQGSSSHIKSSSTQSSQIVGDSFWFKSDEMLDYMDSDVPTGYRFSPAGRRDWYRVGNSWFEVNPEGKIREYGPGQKASITLNNETVTGEMFALGSASLFIPDFMPVASFVRSYIYYKSHGPNGEGTGNKWIGIAKINRLENDSSMSMALRLSFATPVSKAFGLLPKHIDETGMPESDTFRWSFNLMSTSSWIDQGSVFFAVTYKGDVETKTMFPGCHLQWDYPVLTARFTPRLIKATLADPSAAPVWKVTASNPDFGVALRADSDVVCGGIPLYQLNVKDKIYEFIKGNSHRTEILNYLNSNNLGIVVPIGEMWRRVAGPFDIGDTNNPVCFFPDPQLITVGDLQGDPNSASVSASLINNSHIIIGKTCAQIPYLPSEPAVLYRAGGPESYNITTRLLIPYTVLNERLSQANLGASMGTTLSYQLQGRGAYFLLTVTSSGAISDTLQFDVTPIFVPGALRMKLMFVPSRDSFNNHNDSGKKLMLDLAKAFTDSLEFDFSADVGKAKSKLIGSHKFGNLVLNVPTLDVTPFQCISENDGIHLYVRFVGRALAEISMN